MSAEMIRIDFPFRDTALDAYRPFRARIRAMLADDPSAREPRGDCWSRFDDGFSRRLGAAGLLGMTWPRRYGGGERSALERFVLLEELLAAGAPVGAHWIAERQVGPMFLRYGTEAQKQKFLPGIASGELYFCIGLSEPDSGSDLASLRTTATPAPGGWRVSGRKIWTSNAHRSQFMILLCRTDPDGRRQNGLSQLLVDMTAPGISLRPIRNISGEHEFNEVTFDDVFVSREQLVGVAGEGWAQVLSELAYERSGPERFMSSFVLFRTLLREGIDLPAGMLGTLAARFVDLRSLSISVASMLDEGRIPNLEAALVKELGSNLEQEIAELILDHSGLAPVPGGPLVPRLLAETLLHAPSFSLRGGAREILRGIIARGLGMR